MPMLTTSVIRFPETPFHAPLLTRSVNWRMWSSTPLTNGITSWPSTMIGRFERFRSAMWSTALFSVTLIFSPLNILSVQPGRSACLARSRRSCIVCSVMRFFE